MSTVQITVRFDDTDPTNEEEVRKHVREYLKHSSLQDVIEVIVTD